MHRVPAVAFRRRGAIGAMSSSSSSPAPVASRERISVMLPRMIVSPNRAPDVRWRARHRRRRPALWVCSPHGASVKAARADRLLECIDLLGHGLLIGRRQELTDLLIGPSTHQHLIDGTQQPEVVRLSSGASKSSTAAKMSASPIRPGDQPVGRDPLLHDDASHNAVSEWDHPPASRSAYGTRARASHDRAAVL